jgi:hypothetical protein
VAIHKRASKNPAKLLTGIRKLRLIRQFYIFHGLGVPFNTKFRLIGQSSFREDFLENNQSETRIACGGHVC